MVENRLLVLYGSQTFTAQEIAERIWRTTKVLGFEGPVLAMDDYPISQLIHEEFAIFVCATTGQGDEPDNMKKFWKFLLRKNLPSNSLVKLKYGVVGLGDSSYLKFNFAGKKLHKRLMQLGATPLMDIGLCDYQHDLGHDAVLVPWTKQYFSQLKIYFPSINTDSVKTTFVPRWRVKLLKINENGLKEDGLNEDIYFKEGQLDGFNDAKLFEVEKNDRVTTDDHFQDVRHITLKTTDGSNLNYGPGDVFYVRPRNSTEDVNDLFEIFETHNMDIKPHYRLLVEEQHKDMPVPKFLQNGLTIKQIAEQYWDLKAYPTQYVFALLALVSEDKLEKDKCIELSSPEGQEDWLNYCRRPRRTILEVFHDFHKTTSKLTIEILFELFSSIKPRAFSIASSNLQTPTKLDLLVAVVHYYSKLKKARQGLCSNWCRDLSEGDRIYGWIKKGSLEFPEDKSRPLILIGPGTGIAPIISLLKEKSSQGTASKETLHVFFGCRNKEKDFLCRDILEGMVEKGEITLYCAFSRDQDYKIYVQHRISENATTLWELINERNAYIYISGNVKNMPDNVKSAFVEDVLSKGGMTLDEAKIFMKRLEEKKRLQVEAW